MSEKSKLIIKHRIDWEAAVLLAVENPPIKFFAATKDLH